MMLFKGFIRPLSKLERYKRKLDSYSTRDFASSIRWDENTKKELSSMENKLKKYIDRKVSVLEQKYLEICISSIRHYNQEVQGLHSYSPDGHSQLRSSLYLQRQKIERSIKRFERDKSKVLRSLHELRDGFDYDLQVFLGNAYRYLNRKIGYAEGLDFPELRELPELEEAQKEPPKNGPSSLENFLGELFPGTSKAPYQGELAEPQKVPTEPPKDVDVEIKSALEKLKVYSPLILQDENLRKDLDRLYKEVMSGSYDHVKIRDFVDRVSETLFLIDALDDENIRKVIKKYQSIQENGKFIEPVNASLKSIINELRESLYVINARFNMRGEEESHKKTTSVAEESSGKGNVEPDWEEVLKVLEGLRDKTDLGNLPHGMPDHPESNSQSEQNCEKMNTHEYGNNDQMNEKIVSLREYLTSMIQESSKIEEIFERCKTFDDAFNKILRKDKEYIKKDFPSLSDKDIKSLWMDLAKLERKMRISKY